MSTILSHLAADHLPLPWAGACPLGAKLKTTLALPQVRNILKRLFRVYGHMYHSHFRQGCCPVYACPAHSVC